MFTVSQSVHLWRGISPFGPGGGNRSHSSEQPLENPPRGAQLQHRPRSAVRMGPVYSPVCRHPENEFPPCCVFLHPLRCRYSHFPRCRHCSPFFNYSEWYFWRSSMAWVILFHRTFRLEIGCEFYSLFEEQVCWFYLFIFFPGFLME